MSTCGLQLSRWLLANIVVLVPTGLQLTDEVIIEAAQQRYTGLEDLVCRLMCCAPGRKQLLSPTNAVDTSTQEDCEQDEAGWFDKGPSCSTPSHHLAKPVRPLSLVVKVACSAMCTQKYCEAPHEQVRKQHTIDRLALMNSRTHTALRAACSSEPSKHNSTCRTCCMAPNWYCSLAKPPQSQTSK